MSQAIEPGVYNINNDNNDYAVMMYANDAQGVPIVCISNPNGQTQFNVRESAPGSNRYIIGSDRFKYNIGAAPDNLQKQNYPFNDLDSFEWSIEPAGTELYKIHIPNMDAYWFLPDGPSQTRILIQGAQGRPAEVWRMKRVG
ncbi:unnamed protein product [Rhizoctonia solani]|uniref:Uncharacterized protein n=1 Tax=Rhizoctonia solani TaxID=456999 RepID=A0A8H3HF50_9AGAM|nr:unnamed protein product [Rhizoctonia solani]